MNALLRIFPYKATILLESIDLQFPLTALLGSIDLLSEIELHSLKYSPNILAIYWHNAPTYYAFNYTCMFDAGLVKCYIKYMKKI